MKRRSWILRSRTSGTNTTNPEVSIWVSSADSILQSLEHSSSREHPKRQQDSPNSFESTRFPRPTGPLSPESRTGRADSWNTGSGAMTPPEELAWRLDHGRRLKGPVFRGLCWQRIPRFRFWRFSWRLGESTRFAHSSLTADFRSWETRVMTVRHRSQAASRFIRFRCR